MTLNLLGWSFYLIGLIWGNIKKKEEIRKMQDATSYIGEAIKTGDNSIYEDAKYKLIKLEMEQIGPTCSYSIKTHFTMLGLGVFISNIILIFL